MLLSSGFVLRKWSGGLFCRHRSCCARLQRWEAPRVLLSCTEKKRLGSGWRWLGFEFISISEKFRRFSGEIKDGDELWWRLFYSGAGWGLHFPHFMNASRERESTDWCCCLWTDKHSPQYNIKSKLILCARMNVPGLIEQCIILHDQGNIISGVCRLTGIDQYWSQQRSCIFVGWFPRQKKTKNTRIFLLAFGLLQKIISVAKKRFMTLTCFVHDNFDDKCNFFKSWSLNPIIRCKKLNIGHMALQCDHFSRIYQKHCLWDIRTGKK